MITNRPRWLEETYKSYPAIDRNMEVDVAIVGGGLTGILSGYLLAKEGKSVVVLEKKHIGSNATGYTTAFITQDIDTGLTDLVKLFGDDRAKMIWQSHREAIDLLETIVNEEKIDCEFMRCPLYILAHTEKEYRALEEEYATIRRLTFHATLEKTKNLGFAHAGVLTIANQAKFHPIKFLHALAGKVLENSEVLEITEHDGHVQVKTRHATVTAQQVIVATYKPFHNPLQTFMKKGMYTSYVYDMELPKGAIPEGMYLDMANPYHYFRVDTGPKKDLVILGGADHREELPIKELKQYSKLKKYWKDLGLDKKSTIIRKWTGPILEPSDGIALIGPLSDRQFFATAFSGNGMTYAGIAALMARDWVVGTKNIYAELYNPKRIPSLYQLIKKGKDYIAENLHALG